MRQDFTTENKPTDPGSFPKLKLAAGEKARIACIEKAPEMQFVHTLRAPMIGDDGKVMKETINTKKGSREITARSFVGSHLCFGDFETLLKNGIDPVHCVTCAAAETEEGIDRPDRRYAMHVLQYAVQQGTYKPVVAAGMISMQTRVWAFPAKRFEILVDLNETWSKQGGIRALDLLLGPCEPPEQMQKYAINIAAEGMYLQKAADGSQPWLKLAQETYTNSQCPDLTTMIGRRISTDQAREDIEVVKDKVAQANGKKPVAMATNATNATADVAGILDDITPPPAADVPATEDLDGLFTKQSTVAQQPVTPSVADVDSTDPVPPPVTPEAPQESAQTDSGLPDFDEMADTLFGSK